MQKPLQIHDLDVIMDYLLSKSPSCAEALVSVIVDRLREITNGCTTTRFAFLLGDTAPTCLRPDVSPCDLYMQVQSLRTDGRPGLTNTVYGFELARGLMHDHTSAILQLH